MSAAKILITGLPNSGKTSLIKGLQNTLVLSRDGKKFPFSMPHRNLKDFVVATELIDDMFEAISTYKEKTGNFPETIVIDSVSRIFTDMEKSCSTRFSGFNIWSELSKEVQSLVSFINELIEEGMNVVIIAHAVWDETANKYIEVAKGSFAKTGAFLSTVDYAIYIEIKNNKRKVFHKNTYLSRTLLEGMPDSQYVEEFNMQEYINAVKESAQINEAEWSI